MLQRGFPKPVVDQCFSLNFNEFASQEVCCYSSGFQYIDEDCKLCLSILHLVGISEMIAFHISSS